MKNLKRILSIALVFMLVFALAVPALAAEAPSNGTITINNAKENETYKAYRLFDLSLDASNKNYAYTMNKDWTAFFAENGAGHKYVKFDATNDNVALKDNITAAELQELAAAAKMFAEQQNITAYSPEGTAPTLTFKNLPLGYYLVSTSAGTLQALDTTNKNAVMYEKNTTPTIGKTADKTNAAYGDIVSFKIPVTKGGYAWGDYVITDTMTGLALKADTIQVVATAPNTAEVTLSKDVDYTLTSTQNGFTLTILEKTLNKRNNENTDFVYPAGTVFTIKYDAIAKKVVEMENKAELEYANSPEVGKPHDKVPAPIIKVANYEFYVQKVDESKQNQLDGAVFELYKDKDCTQALKFVQKEAAYRLAEKSEEAQAVSEISAGKAKIEGLPAGKYYLKELKAPAGYNKLLQPVEVEIIEKRNTTVGSPYYDQAFDDNGKRIDPTIKMNGVEVPAQNAEFILQVINKTGVELPSTGGIGTTVFYVVGSVLMAAAVVALIVKKKMDR